MFISSRGVQNTHEVEITRNVRPKVKLAKFPMQYKVLNSGISCLKCINSNETFSMRIRLTLSSTICLKGIRLVSNATFVFTVKRSLRMFTDWLPTINAVPSLSLFVVPSLSSIVSKQQWAPFKFFRAFALLLSGGTRGGGPLASEWHSPIGALSTRLFHNVNEKVTPIFGAARGVHVFCCLYKSIDSGIVMSSACLPYMKRCKEEIA